MIEKELIQQAKEKLGDRNADLIMDALGVTDWDTKNLKCRCPYHNEDTASFIYDRKRFRFHCFAACNKSVDVIDALIEGKNMTFNEAAAKICEEANMPQPIQMVGIKTDKSYRYPHMTENPDMTAVYNYLGQRKISKATVDYAGLGCDNKGNIEFPVYNQNDVLKTVKLRPARKIDKNKGEIKCWVQKDTDHSNDLFLMHLANPQFPLLITEGGIDALAAIESGWRNTVSIPLGAGNTKFIDDLWDWLEQFDTIIVAGDNDEAGRKFNKECIARLGQHRTRALELPQSFTKPNGSKVAVSDINETLYWYGKEKVLECITEAIEKPIPTVIDFSDVKDFNLEELAGINTGLAEVDKVLMRLFSTSLTVLFARGASGKTSLTNQIIAEALDQDKHVFLYSQELSNQMTSNWILYSIAGRRNINSFISKEGAPYYRVTNEARKKILDYYRNRLYIYRDGGSIDIDDILETAKVCVQRQNASVIVLDNLTTISCKNCESDLNRQTLIVQKCVNFAITYNVSVILCAHSRKTHEGLGMDDIAGTSNVANLAGRVLALERNGDNVSLKIVKDRFLGKNGVVIPLAFDYPSRRFFTNESELNKVYSWDKGDCLAENPPPCVALDRIVQTEQEVFGA